MFAMFPLTLLIKGEFPSGSTQGQICLLVDVDLSNEDILKRNLISLVWPSLVIFYNLYFARRIDKFKSGMCPKRTMAAIGKYSRNAISYKMTLAVLLWTQLFAIFDVLLLFVYRELRTSHSQMGIFYINNVIWSIAQEAFHISLAVQLNLQAIPYISKPPRNVDFYVLEQKILEPKRDHFNANTDRLDLDESAPDSDSLHNWPLRGNTISVAAFESKSDRDTKHNDIQFELRKQRAYKLDSYSSDSDDETHTVKVEAEIHSHNRQSNSMSIPSVHAMASLGGNDDGGKSREEDDEWDSGSLQSFKSEANWRCTY
jgi:hypothetical protein